MIEFNLGFKLVGNNLEWGRAARPATEQEIKMWWTIERLLSAASNGSGMPVKTETYVASEPEVWSCSKCGGGMIAAPGSNRRSFYHACVPREVFPAPGNNP